MVPSPTIEEQTPTFPPAPPPTEGAWRTLAEGANLIAHWSPDGRYVVIEVQTANAPGRLILDDASGAQIASFKGYGYPVWLDDGHFLAYDSSAMPDDIDRFYDVPGIRVDANTGSATDVDGLPSAEYGNGHGALALIAAADPARPDYVIWHDGTKTRAQPGAVVGWSVQGDSLAVRHPPPGSRGGGGWLEVLSWPGLQAKFVGDKSTEAGAAQFDPSGRYVAFPSYPVGDTSPGELDIVDLADESVASVAWPAGRPTFAWTSAGQVVVDDGSKWTTYAADGSALDVTSVSPSSVIEGSADGSTILRSTHDSGYNITSLSYIRSGQAHEIDLPPGEFGRTWLSPDGSALVAVTFSGGANTAFLMPLR
jgi:hypothetical protein